MQRSRENGFTLLEILAAFVVFSLAFAAVLQVLSGAMRNTVRAADYSEAALWAQSHLDMVGLSVPLEESTDSGDYNDTFRWEMEITPHQPEDDGRGVDMDLIEVELLRIDLTIFWGERGRERKAQFVTIRSRQKQDL